MNMKLHVFLKDKSLVIIPAYILSNTWESKILAPLAPYDPMILK